MVHDPQCDLKIKIIVGNIACAHPVACWLYDCHSHLVSDVVSDLWCQKCQMSDNNFDCNFEMIQIDFFASFVYPNVSYRLEISLSFCYKLTHYKLQTWNNGTAMEDNVLPLSDVLHGDIEWQPLALTLVEYPKGAYSTAHSVLIFIEYA